ncbi:MAG: hypothetical protein V1720_12815 [bacterium]
MKTKIYFIFMLLLCVSFSNFYSQTLDDLITKGDKFYKEFNNQKALETYLEADKKFTNNYEVLWRISRAYVDIAEHMPANNGAQEDAQLAVFQKALDFAERAVKADPKQSVCYLRRAIANGKIALFKGVFSVAGVVNKVKEDCEKAISLGNGGNEIQGVTHYVLGRTHAKISEKWAPARAVLGLGWADIDIALKEYKKAIELKPNFVMFYVDYAASLMEEDRFETAKEMLKKALSSPIEDEDDSEKKKEAKELMKEVDEELN